MSNVAFIGDIDLIRGFEAAGADVFGAKTKEEVARILEALEKKGYKIIFILEDLAKKAWDALKEYEDRFVSIVIMPDYRGDFGLASMKIEEAVVEAVGADILVDSQ